MKYLFITALALWASLCFAQTGRVYGSLTLENGDPAAYALVYITALQKHTVSDEDGEYELPDIPYGNHLLEVKTIEAAPFEKQVEVDKDIIRVPIRLRTNGEVQIEAVTVWGKSEMKQIKDQGYAVGLIDTKKMEIQSIQTSDLLDRSAGVRIRQSGGMGSDMQYNINGLTGSSVRIFIDGIPIRNYGSSFSLSSIPPSMIERIEVYKGVVPGELAEDALGGAINVILKKSVRNNLSTSYSFGSFNTHRWDMSANYRNSKTGFTANGSAFYNSTDNSYKVWGDQVYVTDPVTSEITYVKAKRFHDDYRSYGVNADFGFTDVKWADQFFVGLLLSQMEKDIQHGATMAVVYGDRSSSQNTQMVNLKYEKKDIIEGLNVNAFASYSQGTRSVVDTLNYRYNWYGDIYRRQNGDYYTWSTTGEAGRATLADNKEKMWASRANVSYRLHPQHKLTAHYLFNRFTRDIEDPMLSQAESELTDTRYLTKNVLGATYENNLFDDRLKSTWFVKHYRQRVSLVDPKKVDGQYVADKISNSMSSNGYGAALSYALFPRFLLLFSAEKALRMPEGTELLGNTTENVDAAYDLKPESSTNLNLGFNAGALVWNRHSFSLDVNFFYRDIRDMIARSVSNSLTAETYAYENLGKVLSKGLDAEFRYDYNHMIIVNSNLSVFNARFNLQYDEHGTQYSYYKDRLRNAPYLTSNSNVEFVRNDVLWKGSRLSVNYNFSYVHEFFRNWESLGGSGKAVIPTQLVHDAGIAYTLPGRKITLSFDARNITDEQIFDNWALQKAGRALYGKISYRIF